MADTCNPIIGKVEAGGRGGQGQPHLHSGFEASETLSPGGEDHN